MTAPNDKELKSSLKDAHQQGLSDEVEGSIEARLGAAPSEEE